METTVYPSWNRKYWNGAVSGRTSNNNNKTTENEVLKFCGSILYTLKYLQTALLTTFSSTYPCKSLFSVIICAKSSQRCSVTDETSAVCIILISSLCLSWRRITSLIVTCLQEHRRDLSLDVKFDAEVTSCIFFMNILNVHIHLSKFKCTLLSKCIHLSK